LGALAGWHQSSPFWVGVDAEWGSWFAYRAVVLTDTALPVTPRRERVSPCLTCADTPCVRACPAGALANGAMESCRLLACLNHRVQPASPCQDRCQARNACPIGVAHRYTDEQTAYHYLQSMPAVRAFVRGAQEPAGG
jgi:epoxyqueuosine reductase